MFAVVGNRLVTAPLLRPSPLSRCRVGPLQGDGSISAVKLVGHCDGLVRVTEPRAAQVNTHIVALSEAVPQLATVLPTVITACGAILAAFSDPPERVRKQ